MQPFSAYKDIKYAIQTVYNFSLWRLSIRQKKKNKENITKDHLDDKTDIKEPLNQWENSSGKRRRGKPRERYLEEQLR